MDLKRSKDNQWYIEVPKEPVWIRAAVHRMMTVFIDVTGQSGVLKKRMKALPAINETNKNQVIFGAKNDGDIKPWLDELNKRILFEGKIRAYWNVPAFMETGYLEQGDIDLLKNNSACFTYGKMTSRNYQQLDIRQQVASFSTNYKKIPWDRERYKNMTTERKISDKVRFMYIRNFDKAPVGCIAYRILLGENEQTVKYGVSFCNPRDHFNPERARKIASERMEDLKKRNTSISFVAPREMPLGDLMLRLLVHAQTVLGFKPEPRRVSIKVAARDDSDAVLNRVEEQVQKNANALTGPEALFEMVYNRSHKSGFSSRIFDRKIEGVKPDLFFEYKSPAPKKMGQLQK